MSTFDFPSLRCNCESDLFEGVQRVAFSSGPTSPRRVAVDRSIDAALRSVPLPDGLMTRLDRLAESVSDDTADQVDWLGC